MAAQTRLSLHCQNAILFEITCRGSYRHITYFVIAAWQSRIAAKPVQGVVGFLIAAFIWFAIPVTISTTTGLAYLATASQNATNMLSAEDIDRGNTSVDR